jgi:hypothetical protein
MSCEIYSIQNDKLFNAYKKYYSNDENLRIKFRILRGEFDNYYSYNLRKNFIKFSYNFIKSLFYYQEFKVNFINNETNSKVLTVNTSDYIYNDNIKPITDILYKDFNFDKIKLDSFNKFGFSFKKNDFPLKIFFHKEVLFNFYNLILSLYLYLIIFPKLNRVEKEISKLKYCKYKLILSADPCDLFSRLIYKYKLNSKYILIQNGLIFKGTPEWNSILCDLVVAWKINESFFVNNKINYKTFFPPRFYYLKNFNTIHDKIFHLVFFLPWLHNNSSNNPLIKTIENAIKFSFDYTKTIIYLRYHPAGRIKLNLPKDIYEEIDLSISTKDILLNSDKTINLGSTISFDCMLLGKYYGILNFDKQIETDSQFFNSEFSRNIKNTDDLKCFLRLENKRFLNKNIGNDIDQFTNYIKQELR